MLVILHTPFQSHAGCPMLETVLTRGKCLTRAGHCDPQASDSKTCHVVREHGSSTECTCTLTVLAPALITLSHSFAMYEACHDKHNSNQHWLIHFPRMNATQAIYAHAGHKLMHLFHAVARRIRLQARCPVQGDRCCASHFCAECRHVHLA